MKNDVNHDPLDILHDDFLALPKGFEQRVMQQIAQSSPIISQPNTPLIEKPRLIKSLWRIGLAWLALISSLLLGMGQIMGFIFSLWTLSAAI
jgi:hypothetical protein